MPILSSISTLPGAVETPAYTPDNHGIGIVHLGLGAFHRAHQAFYTDCALAASGGDWKILGVSLRSTAIPEAVNAQNGLYTVITRDANENQVRVIASIDHAICAKQAPSTLLQEMASPGVRIVSLTVTENGYGIHREHGGVDLDNPQVQHDLNHPETPGGVLGFLVGALDIRRKAGLDAFTILCCDNLPDNGTFVKNGVLDFATRVNPELAQWIEDTVAFPSTMVDRITPASSESTRSLSEKATGFIDELAIETEPFHQWVIEDHFSNGRPDWAAAGAIFTDNVAPFEEMKLRMLNGTHSMLAYAGFLSGQRYVRDVMQNNTLSTLVSRHMQAAALTLSPIDGVDYDDYQAKLLARFSNPCIAHETRQIASDGSQKLPQRIFEPALAVAQAATEARIDTDTNLRAFALATGVWMHYCRGVNDDGVAHVINDPIAHVLQTAALMNTVDEAIAAFNAIPGLVPPALQSKQQWITQLSSVLSSLRKIGVKETLEREVLL